MQYCVNVFYQVVMILDSHFSGNTHSTSVINQTRFRHILNSRLIIFSPTIRRKHQELLALCPDRTCFLLPASLEL